jgi:hypothetical protein
LVETMQLIARHANAANIGLDELSDLNKRLRALEDRSANAEEAPAVA